jgi:hypothetical protein
MKIAGDELTITLGEEEIILHPSLRHAIRLNRRSGGFPALARDIADGSLTAALDIIEPNAEFSRDYLAELIMSAGPDRMRPVFLQYILACAGIDPDDAPHNENISKQGKPRKSEPRGEFYEGLYKIGTGWLGWSPEVTLDSTIFEIMLAHRGRLEMLKAVFGGSEEQPKDDRPLPGP